MSAEIPIQKLINNNVHFVKYVGTIITLCSKVYFITRSIDRVFVIYRGVTAIFYYN